MSTIRHDLRLLTLTKRYDVTIFMSRTDNIGCLSNRLIRYQDIKSCYQIHRDLVYNTEQKAL